MDRRVLFISHNGLTEPLGRRQVLPYILGLSARGWRFEVLSFEKAEMASPDAVDVVQDLTQRAGIRWHPARYHRRPPLISTAFDVLRGALKARWLTRGVGLVHARSTVPAVMARLACGFGRPWIFDVRGLLAEEYADAGHWRRGGLRYRLTSAAERRLLSGAAGRVVLTSRIADRIGGRSTVIPCCVDTDVFRPCEDRRREIRGLLDSRFDRLLVYSGSLGSWYRLDDMLEFFRVASEELPSLGFLLLTPQPAVAVAAARRLGLESRVRGLAVSPDEVPRYLAAADAGICFLGKLESKVASSPTKYGEYLASGLPVITNPWIGDAGVLASEPSWLLVPDFGESHYRAAARRLTEMLTRCPEEARAAARDLARREFALASAVERYDALYRSVLDGRERSR
jgi:glycosyltransferase involved in cell wall biosynthesis